MVVAPLAGGAELAAPAAAVAKSDPAELPLSSKTKVPFIFLGEIRDIVSNFEDRPPASGTLPRNSDLFVSVLVLNTLKSPDGKPLAGRVYLRFGGNFEMPRGLQTTWGEMESAFRGRRFVFFGHDVTEIGKGVLLVNSGRTIKPEIADKEREVRRILAGFVLPPLIDWETGSFQLIVFKDGQVELTDWTDASRPRVRRKVLQPSQIDKLVSEFEKYEFFSLKNRYTVAKIESKSGEQGSLRIDTPRGIVLKFSDGDRKKTVSHTVGAPSELLALEKSIRAIVGVDELMGRAPSKNK